MGASCGTSGVLGDSSLALLLSLSSSSPILGGWEADWLTGDLDSAADDCELALLYEERESVWMLTHGRTALSTEENPLS